MQSPRPHGLPLSLCLALVGVALAGAVIGGYTDAFTFDEQAARVSWVVALCVIAPAVALLGLRRGGPTVAALALLAGGALLAGCGNDLPNTVYDCCPLGGFYYVCNSRSAWGRCTTGDVTQCTLQVGLSCPANPRQ